MSGNGGRGWLQEVRPRSRMENAGGKASGIRDLMKMGFRAPRSWSISYHAHEAFLKDPQGTVSELSRSLEEVISSDRPLAVRSSADVEDQEGSSYAGQFLSLTDVRGHGHLMRAIEQVWRSAEGATVKDYRETLRHEREAVRMGVLLQVMVESKVSGVAFSRNPLNGRREVVVEAVEGHGDALVQRGVTPTRLVDGMTSGEGAAALQEVLVKVERGASRIARRAGKDVDLEWVFDGRDIYWVQMRSMGPVKEVPLYSNRMAKEMLPGAIKPLVWSVNVPLVNGAWVRIFSELSGRRDLDPLRLSKAFYYRAYFNMGEIGKIWASMGLPRDSLETLVLGGGGMKMSPTPKMAAMLPRIGYFGLRQLGLHRQIVAFIDEAVPRYRAILSREVEGLTDQEVLRTIDELFKINGQAAYYNILAILMSAMHNRMLKKMLAMSGMDINEVEWLDGKDEVLVHYPHLCLAELRAFYDALGPEARSEVDACDLETLSRRPEAGDFLRKLEDFTDRFGHISESGNDLTVPPLREQPSAIVRLMMQSRVNEVRARPRPGLASADLPLLLRPWVHGMARRASRCSALKERMSSTYSLGYGAFRPMFLELGRRLVSRGALGDPRDIFFLGYDEVKEALVGGAPAFLLQLVEKRRSEMDALSAVTLPDTIFGDDPPPLVSPLAEVLKGIASSTGRFQGRARLVKGMDDFAKVGEGDIVVIPYSDVSWSSVLFKASAIVSESGGMLSHSSVLARELGIPAVVSVPHAMAIPDGAVLLVDGYKGMVSIVQ